MSTLPVTRQDVDEKSLHKTTTDQTLTSETPPFLLSVKEIASKLKVDLENGHAASAIKELHAKYGPNELSGGGGVSPWSILAAQMCVSLCSQLATAFQQSADHLLSNESYHSFNAMILV